MLNLEILFFNILEKYIPENFNKKLSSNTELIEIKFESMKLLNILIELDQKVNFDFTHASKEVDFYTLKTINDLLNVILKYQKR